MMGVNLNPILKQELANLDKDADSRKSAMKALKSYVKDLDSKAIPVFLAQVSETKETGFLSGEYTISLYEILARVHGAKIVPQIDNIMSTIIKTLSSSAGSFPLQQACSKVVPAIARYGIDPTTPEKTKMHIIHSLCKPLLDSLLGSHESLTSGAALCLKALVDCDNWRFASDDMVNRVCQSVAVALDANSSQTNSQMGLAMSLAKRNPLVVEAYARLFLHSGLKVLNFGLQEGSSQKRLSAVQMLNFLMKCLDSRSVYSEVELIIEEMKKCQSDPMAFVRGAAYETMLTAKRIAGEKESKYEKGYSSGTGSVTGSNFGTGSRNRARNLSSGVNSPSSLSPESRTFNSFTGYDSQLESPVSMANGSYSKYDCRSVNRKLWSRGNERVDVSLKDGFFSGITQGSMVSDSPLVPYDSTEIEADFTDEFEGFIQKCPENEFFKSATPSPQKPGSCVNLESFCIFSTPRRLMRALQDPDGKLSDSSSEQSRSRSPCALEFEQSPIPKHNGYPHNLCNQITERNKILYKNDNNVSGGSQGGSESVSSTGGSDITCHDVPQNGPQVQMASVGKTGKITGLRLVMGILFVLAVVFVSMMWIDVEDQQHYPLPT